MDAKGLFRRVVMGAAGVVVAGAAATTIATPASASISTGRIQLCSQGNYRSFIDWGSAATVIVPQGTCQTFNFPSPAIYRFDVKGIYNTNPATFTVVTFATSVDTIPFGSSHPGMALGTRGTTTSFSYDRWQ